MDTNQTTPVPTFTNKEVGSGPSKTLKIITGIASVIAIIGIGFGVYGIIQAQSLKSAQTHDSENQIATEGDCVTTEDTANQSEAAEDNESATTIVDDANTTNPTSYLYLGAWKLKIAIPDTLKSISYIYTPQDTLCISGVKYRENGMHYFPEFADITKNTPGLVCVSRTLKDNYSYDDSPLEAFDYTIQNSQSVYSTDKDEQDWEVASMTEIVQNMLNLSNFSKI